MLENADVRAKEVMQIADQVRTGLGWVQGGFRACIWSGGRACVWGGGGGGLSGWGWVWGGGRLPRSPRLPPSLSHPPLPPPHAPPTQLSTNSSISILEFKTYVSPRP